MGIRPSVRREDRGGFTNPELSDSHFFIEGTIRESLRCMFPCLPKVSPICGGVGDAQVRTGIIALI